MTRTKILAMGLLCALASAPVSAVQASQGKLWSQIEQVLGGVAANYIAEPDADSMMRGALVNMTLLVKGAQLDSTTHASLYRIRSGRQLIASLSRPSDIDEVMTAILKVSELLANISSIEQKNLVNAGLRGAVHSLGNCYTVYLTPDMVQRLSYAPGETPADVGLSLACGQSGLVRHVRPGSPAFLAGIELGDRVLSVDGRCVQELDAAEVFALLIGRAGSIAKLRIKRQSGVELSMELMRLERAVDQPLVRELASGSIVYLRPGPMNEHTMKKAVLHCENRIGVILDLRGNEGGRVDVAERFAGLFLEPGPIASIEGRGKRVVGHLNASLKGPCAKVPLVVVVDRETASAAELIAQALRERRNAPLIGQPTFGKGSVQQILSFEDGAVAKVTTARYLSPSGKPLDRSLQPDKVLADSGVFIDQHTDPTVDPLVREAIARLMPPPLDEDDGVDENTAQ